MTPVSRLSASSMRQPAVDRSGAGAPGERGASASLPTVPVVPAVSLPKGGGAVRGLGDNLTVNPATGTATLRIPLPTTAGRSGFGPSLAMP